MTRSKEALVACLATLVIAGLALAGLPEALGAHPWWAVKTGVGGAVGGALAYGVLRGLGLGRRPVALLAGLALPGALAAAYFGKVGFVNSFAENHLAGRFWFLGWIATAAAATALVAALLSVVWRKLSR
ncbi:hypothetical protein [Nioella nitratireducens]|uniref:hypothetical protein n=1 Tax=Nioella nitratireducens TaxID=1287720 RepID=UPI0008FD2F9F|nr:hypothetical protein [Nioella nitratireducens]